MPPRQSARLQWKIPPTSLPSQLNRHNGPPSLPKQGPSAITGTDASPVRLNAESRSNSVHGCPPISTITENSVIKRPFQACVESDADDDEPRFDDDSSGRVTTAYQYIGKESGTSTPSITSMDSSYIRLSQQHQRMPRDVHSMGNEALTPPPSPESSPKQRPTVHFSSRPVLLHYRRADCDEYKQAQSQYDDDMLQHEPRFSAADARCSQLFEGGEPTDTLKQILRGLANYLIREYEPHNSLVLPPCKLDTFYKTYKLDKEQLLFQDIFELRSRNAMRSLELLYQDLRCEYHLIQDHKDDRPYVPALTPNGFVTWCTALIQAAPESEVKRLHHIVADLPIEIEGHDIVRQRVPKHQVSRHLFPDKRNETIFRNLVDALGDWRKRMGSHSEPTSPSSDISNSNFDDATAENSGNDNKYTSNSGAKRSSSHREYYHEKVGIGDAKRHSTPSYTANLRDQQRRKQYRDHISCNPNDARNRDVSPRPIIHDSHRRESSDCAARRRRAKSKDEYIQGASHGTNDWRGTGIHYNTGVYANMSPPISNQASPQGSPSRKDSYRYFQGRASTRGPRYDDLVEISRR